MTSSAVPGTRSGGQPGWDDDDELVAERQALRRVPGLSTELEDISEVEYRRLRLERVVLVGVWTEGTLIQAEQSLAELARLAETAGSEVVAGFVQRRSQPDAATYIGSGKVAELRETVAATGVDTVIFDGELSPGQLSNLEKAVDAKVVDRTWLILDIFAQHARSREGKAQVELAQMQYLLPRLRGWGEAMSRQEGGIGAIRGPGETKLEIDRRRIRRRTARLRRDIAAMETARDVSRSVRRASVTPSVAIAGYTNAGKSSLLNRLTGARVLVENALFATLDPTVRRARTPAGREFTVTDTVGFVRHLPHQLVEAFRSSLEEVAEADLILHVVDASDPAPEDQLRTVREVLRDVGADQVPELVVINKVDVADPAGLTRLRRTEPHAVEFSAITGSGLDGLLAAIEHDLPEPGTAVDVVIPYERGDLLARAHREGQNLEIDHRDEGTQLRGRVPAELGALLQQADVSTRER